MINRNRFEIGFILIFAIFIYVIAGFIGLLFCCPIILVKLFYCAIEIFNDNLSTSSAKRVMNVIMLMTSILFSLSGCVSIFLIGQTSEMKMFVPIAILLVIACIEIFMLQNLIKKVIQTDFNDARNKIFPTE